MSGHGAVEVLEIRHVDVDDAVQSLENVHPFPAAGVVHERKLEPHTRSPVDAEQNMRRVMGGCDDVDVMTALPLKINHHPGEVIKARRAALAFLADLPIDAEDASEGTVREEYRP